MDGWCAEVSALQLLRRSADLGEFVAERISGSLVAIST